MTGVADSLVKMTELGTSVVLTWGEDTGQWECSWITSGQRYTGIDRDIRKAVYGARAAVAKATGQEA